MCVRICLRFSRIYSDGAITQAALLNVNANNKCETSIGGGGDTAADTSLKSSHMYFIGCAVHVRYPIPTHMLRIIYVNERTSIDRLAFIRCMSQDQKQLIIFMASAMMIYCSVCIEWNVACVLSPRIISNGLALDEYAV